jgi:RNA polymerase sigma-70 factor (ECF subfamily)
MRFNKRFVPEEEISQESAPGQEERYIAKEESDTILAALARLGDDERDILALIVSSGLCYQEIADIRQCSVANIKVKVHRARQKLKKLLQENNHG